MRKATYDAISRRLAASRIPSSTYSTATPRGSLVIQAWADIVASSITWEQAHVTFENAVAKLPEAARGQRPRGFPHSIWELVEHIRLAQRDLLEFCENANYQEPRWPDDYWPPSPQPPSDDAWRESLEAIQRDSLALANFTTEHAAKLGEKIPHGSGQTYLRTVLVAVDHTAYHVGQIVAVRRMLGEWPRNR
jgi:uncharacterized damage-inducible protein DinB